MRDEEPKADFPWVLTLIVVALAFGVFCSGGCAARKHPSRLPGLVNGNN